MGLQRHEWILNPVFDTVKFKTNLKSNCLKSRYLSMISTVIVVFCNTLQFKEIKANFQITFKKGIINHNYIKLCHYNFKQTVGIFQAQ